MFDNEREAALDESAPTDDIRHNAQQPARAPASFTDDPTGDTPCAIAFRAELFLHDYEREGIDTLRIFAERAKMREGEAAAIVISMYRAACRSGDDRAALRSLYGWMRERVPDLPEPERRLSRRIAAETYADATLSFDAWCREWSRERKRSPDGHARPDARETHGARWRPIADVARGYGLPERTLKAWCKTGALVADKRKSYRGPPSWWINVSASADRLGPCRNGAGSETRSPEGLWADAHDGAGDATAVSGREGVSASRSRRHRQGSRWMALAEVARRSGQAASTLRGMCERGEVPAQQRPGLRGREWWIDLGACAAQCEDAEEWTAKVDGLFAS